MDYKTSIKNFFIKFKLIELVVRKKFFKVIIFLIFIPISFLIQGLLIQNVITFFPKKHNIPPLFRQDMFYLREKKLH